MKTGEVISVIAVDKGHEFNPLDSLNVVEYSLAIACM